jgi:hypothetical protein
MSSNFRLVNAGSTVPAVSAPCHYKYNVGLYGLVHAITLYCDGTVIDRMTDANLFMGFRAINKTNALLSNLSYPLELNWMGFSYGTDDQIEQVNFGGQNTVTNDPATTATGIMYLSQMLPYLQSSLVAGKEALGSLLPGNRMNGAIRLVIEWENQRDVYDAAGVAPASILPPLLVMEEILDPGMIKQVGSAAQLVTQYMALEEDMCLLPFAAVAAGKNTLQNKMNAFNGKIVNRMLYIIQPQSTQGDASFLGRFASTAQFDEAFQLYVNGAKQFPYKGIMESKTAMLTDTWGVCCIPQGSQFYLVDGVTANGLFGAGLAPFNTRLGYGGFTLGTKVEEMILEFTATTIAFNPTSAASILATGGYQGPFNIYLYGEVPRAVIIAGSAPPLVEYL